MRAKNQVLRGGGGTADAPPLDAAEIYRQYQGYAQRLRPHVADTTAYLLDAVEAGKRILFEGGPGRSAGRRSRHLPLRHQQQQFRRGRVGGLGRAGADTSPRSSAC